VTNESETAIATPAEEAPSRTSRGRRALLLLAVAVIVLDVAAAVLAPPPGFPDPKSTIDQNLEVIPPTVVLDLAPGEAESTDALQVNFHPSITSSILTSWIVMAGILLFAIAASRRMKLVPGRLQNAWETIYEQFNDFGLALGGPPARRYIPLFAALFLFIMFANWTDLFLFGDKVNILRTPTSDINITVGLALVSFVVFHVEGVRSLGVRGYLAKFFNFSGFRHGLSDGFIDLFVGLTEFLLEFFKPVTLAFRLFGNLYGGGIMVGVFTALLFAVLPLPFIALEGFVGFVQALIFSVLTLMFTLIAIEGHGEEEHAAPVYASEPEGNVGPPIGAVSPQAATHS
jgi:F-type H+-transporting ATPase subunit a